MNRRYYLIISIILSAVVIVSLISVVYISNYISNRTAQDTLVSMSTTSVIPSSLYYWYYDPVGQNSSGDIVNASQGITQQLNLTLQSTYSKQIVIPIENLTLIAYNSSLDYKTWDTSTWNTSLVQETVFNYSFSLNQLTLQPNMSNSTIISIKWADNAPTGGYLLCLNLSKAEFLSSPAKNNDNTGQSIEFTSIVYPKGT